MHPNVHYFYYYFPICNNLCVPVYIRMFLNIWFLPLCLKINPVHKNSVSIHKQTQKTTQR